MNKDNIEIAPFDNLLVYKKGYTAEFVSKIIKERNLGGLRIFAVLKEDRLENLNFLKGYSFLEKLDVTSALDYDFGFLQELTRLKKLSISTEGSNVINIGDLVNLEYLTVKWRKEIIGFENCSRLSSLTLVEFSEKDLSKIQNLKSLSHLRIKTGCDREYAWGY